MAGDAHMGLSDHRITRGRLQIYVEPRDIWVGVFIAPTAVYVCPLPMLVLRYRKG